MLKRRKKQEPEENKENTVLVWGGTYSSLKRNAYTTESQFTNLVYKKGRRKTFCAILTKFKGQIGKLGVGKYVTNWEKGKNILMHKEL